ncbi:putative ABC-type transporter periplasmic subunit family 3 [Desulfamplus magnetovallimortis]|uniref:Putative ABC-type transporter periplasmic subunit family 3 n=1 Tax=Desulfamplus magnetovallimortis TaxID=1246637 RepID=A0A1W1HHU0_9BACT|nr:transporter substrate-binding domain-containing protein [Desulfamplus magnetovallimortis]SLM32071.1 putative ABC-type transporter periplasmic subunit family 3 [Desulfamplus magnetovallimortis]
MKRGLTVLFFITMITLGAGNLFAETETITLATLNWQPFYGEDLPEKGFFAAISREAFKRAGYEMKIEFMPWKRALEMAKKGKYDGLLGAYHSEERAQEFYFTDPVSQNEEVFFQKKGKGIAYSNIEDLKQYKIGGLRGAAPLIELNEKGFNVEETNDDLMSMKKLNAGRIDLLVIGKQQLYYNIANVEDLKGFKDEFEAIEPPFKSFDLFCPITRKKADGEEIVKKFNAALQEMKADGTYDDILKRFGQK